MTDEQKPTLIEALTEEGLRTSITMGEIFIMIGVMVMAIGCIIWLAGIVEWFGAAFCIFFGVTAFIAGSTNRKMAIKALKKAGYDV